jgi:ribosome modulation factor
MKEDILLPHLRLKLNLEHLNFESCYCDGYLAAAEDRKIEDSPFKENSKEQEYWLEGWWAGFYGEEALFDLELERAVESVGSEHLTEVQFKDEKAANDPTFSGIVFGKVARVAGAIAATALIGYQVLDLIA